MSALGIDFGNRNCHVMNNKPTYHIDSFFCGPNGNLETHISQIKCLLGWKFHDPELQSQLHFLPFRVIEGPNSIPLIHGKCMGKDRAFTPIEILAMLISSEFLTEINNPELPGRINSFGSLCMGIPMYFTKQQKSDVLQAAKIAGLEKSFDLRDETTAMILAFRKNLCVVPCISPYTVAFVDVGHAGMQVCFAEFEGDSLRSVLYKAYSRSLGGREFDKVLFKYFASKIAKKYKIDVYKSGSACLCLSEACERLKKDMSKYNEASFSIEKFSGSIDVRGSITREVFENLSVSILKRIEVALEKALSESGLCKVDLVEAVGKGCLMPAIINTLHKVFGKEPRKMAYCEYVARGCTIESELKLVLIYEYIHCYITL
jgi:heat shock 70kDa protein 4